MTNQSYKRRILYISALALLTTGVALSCIQKWQNRTTGYNGRVFDHPFVQASLNAFGQMIGFVLYFGRKWYYKGKPQNEHEKREVLSSDEEDDTVIEVLQKSEQPNPVYLAIPEALDTVETALKNVSLTCISASVTQMLRSSTIVFCAILSIIFLRRIYYRHHFTSLVTIVVGVFLVGLSYMMNASSEDNTTIWGILILLTGEFFGSGAYIVEEKYFGDFEDLDPFLLVGFEGLWGALFWIIALPILQFIPCDIDSLCTNGVVEDTYGAILDYGANPMLILQSVLLIVLVGLFNISGCTITKYGSAAQRTTVDCSRNLFVWLFFLVVPVYGKYIETFAWLQLFGFIVLVFGILIFNEILVLPFWGFDKYTAAAFEEIKAKQEQRQLIKRSSKINETATVYASSIDETTTIISK